MNKRVIFGVVALAALAGVSARADDKADAAKMYAEWNAIPDGTVTPAVADALAFESQTNFAPRPQELVYEMPTQKPSTGNSYSDGKGDFDWTERAKLSQIAPNLFKLESLPCVRSYPDSYVCGQLDTLIIDRTGLIVLYRKNEQFSGSGEVNYGNHDKVSGLTITAPQPSVSAPALPFSGYSYVAVSAVERTKSDCQLTNLGNHADAVCKGSGIHIDFSGNIKGYAPGEGNFNGGVFSAWNVNFNMYMPSLSNPTRGLNYGDGCYDDVCDERSHKVVDYRLPGGDWHSKAMSAALSPVDKQKATALFSAGFDSCKTGDFTGGIALLQRGLATDPANYQAHYTLADCARSAWLNKQDDYWLRSVAFYYYQRTDDLAPDSPEGVKAQGRLDGGLK